LSIIPAAGSSISNKQQPKIYSDKKQFLNTVLKSYQNAETWFLNNIREKGVFVYLYDPYTDRYADKNNTVRQLMAARLLAELTLSDPDLGSVHQKNMQFIFTNWYREDDQRLGYIFYDNKSKLGANAMALRTLAFSPLFEAYMNQAQKIAEGAFRMNNHDRRIRLDCTQHIMDAYRKILEVYR
jgi:hypothetical protein